MNRLLAWGMLIALIDVITLCPLLAAETALTFFWRRRNRNEACPRSILRPFP
jgi:hypothetical protein